MKNNPLKHLWKLGQSIWLDDIQRELTTNGGLRRLIVEDGVRGMTSNPAIFAKAITGSHDYDADIAAMAHDGKDAAAIYDTLSQHDVRCAADAFRPLYDRTCGKDGFVSLEVDPHLAHDTNRTIQEAHRLWRSLDRPNVLIKIPATAEGLPAIQQLVGEGININVTLLFGLPRYRQVAEAYIAGLEARLAQGGSVLRVASVASFFISRIDALVDPLLAKRIAQHGASADQAKDLYGQVAIASAKMAYQVYRDVFRSDRFRVLVPQGAQPQRLLWASTGVKNRDFSDVKYVEALIGNNTVNTVPIATLNAYRDHGVPTCGLEHDIIEAAQRLKHLPDFGIDLDTITRQLEDEGIGKFVRAYDQLLAALAKKSGTRR